MSHLHKVIDVSYALEVHEREKGLGVDGDTLKEAMVQYFGEKRPKKIICLY